MFFILRPQTTLLLNKRGWILDTTPTLWTNMVKGMSCSTNCKFMFKRKKFIEEIGWCILIVFEGLIIMNEEEEYFF